jgi:hypothetical protein
VSSVAAPLLGRLTADRACRRWVAAAVRDLSAVDGSRALGVGPGATSFAGLLTGRHEYVLATGPLPRGVVVLPGGASGHAVRVDHRELLEVEPEIDGRFDLVLAVDTIRRLNADDIVLPHLGWLLAAGGHLLALDRVHQKDWPVVRSRYGTFLPGVRVDQVQPGVMGVQWKRPI